ncbi:MAG: hypothetical protein M4579_004293 [Chaenotheca gracillima]|nr:MAG: hypothetical protein M4579_004293 [Chaenotheca gracillima]
MFKTTGVSNIEAAYTRGGGGANHLPGSASHRVDAENGRGNTETHQGLSSEVFRDRFEDQKPEPGMVAKAWHQMTSGTDRGK